MRLSFLVLSSSLAGASHLMSSLSLSTPFLASLSLTSLSLPLTSPSPSSTFSPPTLTSTPTSSPSLTSTTSTSSSSSSSVPSSTPSSSASSTSAQTSTSSTSTAPADVAQQPSSSSTPTSLATTAGLSSPDFSSSVAAFTSATITPSSTATNSASSGFFSNTGAVAGTFTVIGLVSVAGVIAVALLIIRRRHSRSYEEDMEYLDKNPDLSADPPMTHVTSVEDGFTSDHGHYAAPPMVLATPPTAYYPDHAYALHPNTFPADPSGSRGYPSPYPAAYTQDHAAQHIYSTDDYDIAYPPSVPPVHHNMPNPHGEFADVELVSTPVPPTQAVFPDALRPSAKSTLIVPKQWANTRFSVDSFYAGIATDNHPPSGQAL